MQNMRANRRVEMGGNLGATRVRTAVPASAVALVLALLMLLGLAPGRPAAAAAAAAADDQLRRVIVELDGTPALAATVARGTAPRRMDARMDATARRRVKAASDALRAGQRAVLDRARGAGVRATDERSYSLLLNAVAMRVPAGDLDRLAKVPGVAAVHPDRPMRASTETSVPLVGAPELWDRTDGQGRPVRGEGVTVAVVDTGIDYTHPDLGGGFGEGRKVVGGYDFVNDDPDPMDDNSHGTHVAGIIAGAGAVTGVAPAARLTAYKALDDWGAGFESDIVAAIEAAADPANPHRADVINLSLGGDGDGTEPLGQAATAASRAGTVVIAAAGNAGPGAQTVGTPAAADGVVAVGASTSGLRLPTAYLASPKRELLQTYRSPISANPPERPVTADLVDIGEGRPEDYDRAGDVRGKVVVAHMLIAASPEQVSVWLIEQAREAERRGAVALIGYERIGGGPVAAAQAGASPATVPTPAAGEVPAIPHGGVAGLASGDSLRMDRIVVLGMHGDQYDELAGYLRQGPVRVSIEGTDVTDQIASFSSRGPTSRFTLKPELVAPGVEIRSTIPRSMWAPGEQRYSGTSMASPHVAGAAALLRQLHPDHDQSRVAAALIGTAKPLTGTGPVAQGAGRLDLPAAAGATVTASPPSLSLGLADLARSKIDASGTVTLRNDGAAPVTATIRTATAPGSPGTASAKPGRATIPAGGTVKVTVRVDAKRPAAAADLAGWVTVDLPGPAPDLRVPYLLAARPLVVQASPDPSDGTSTAFVYSPAPLAQPPVVTVTPPRGRETEVTTRLDHGGWYRAEVGGTATGAYRLRARASTAAGQRLVGEGAFEVVPPEQRGHGGRRWEPVGPNSTAGTLTTSPAAPGQGMLTLFGRAGVWRTADKGATWSQNNRLPVAGGNGTVVVDPRDGSRMWYAVNGSAGGFFGWVFDPTYQGKVLRSGDGGRTWTTLGFPDVHVYALAVDDGGSALVAVTADAVVVSHDGGDTWASHAGGWGGEEPDGAAIAGDDLYVSTFSRVWVVRGVTGTPEAPAPVYAPDRSYVTDVAADRELVAVGRGDGTVLGSRDGGRSWTQLFKPDGFGSALTLRIAGGDIFMASYFEDYVGRDHGSSWTAMPKPVRGPLDGDFDRWPGDPGTVVVSSEQGGLFATTDQGGSYRRIGVQGMTVHDLAAARDQQGRPVLLAGTESSVYRTSLPTGGLTPATAEWGLSGFEGFIGTTVGHLAVSPADPKVVWRIRKAAISFFDVDRSDDGGANWRTIGRTYEFPDALLVHPADPDRVVVAFRALDGIGLYVTKDAGATWKKLYHPTYFTALAGDPADPDRLWLGSPTGLYRSDDGGITVTRVLDTPVRALWLDPRARRLVAGGDRIHVSSDGGRTFREADTGELPVNVSSVAASPTDPGTLYAGTTSHTANGLLKGGRGVLRSSDGGRTWVNVSAGLQNTAVTSLAFSPDGRWLYAGTVSGGTHRLRLGHGWHGSGAQNGLIRPP
jgi:subtilisin family serine protease